MDNGDGDLERGSSIFIHFLKCCRHQFLMDIISSSRLRIVSEVFELVGVQTSNVIVYKSIR